MPRLGQARPGFRRRPRSTRLARQEYRFPPYTGPSVTPAPARIPEQPGQPGRSTHRVTTPDCALTALTAPRAAGSAVEVGSLGPSPRASKAGWPTLDCAGARDGWLPVAARRCKAAGRHRGEAGEAAEALCSNVLRHYQRNPRNYVSLRALRVSQQAAPRCGRPGRPGRACRRRAPPWLRRPQPAAAPPENASGQAKHPLTAPGPAPTAALQCSSEPSH